MERKQEGIEGSGTPRALLAVGAVREVSFFINVTDF